MLRGDPVFKLGAGRKVIFQTRKLKTKPKNVVKINILGFYFLVHLLSKWDLLV